MSYGIKLEVSGAYACFTRPEAKVERVSYDVLTPSAARGILEAIYWKPAICWHIDRIHVLNPVRFESIRRNEVAYKLSASKANSAMNKGDISGVAVASDEMRQQRASTVLKNVRYIIEAHFELTHIVNKNGLIDENAAKHLECFNRRAQKGQCFHRPCLGTREFAADFTPFLGEFPAPHEELKGERDLGLMLHDIDYAAGFAPRFFAAVLKDGVLTPPPFTQTKASVT